MGLDISAYKKIQKIDAVFDQEGEPIDPQTREELDNVVRFYVNPDFNGRADDIENRAVYRYEDSYGFCAGSYSGYNWWREELAQLSGWPLTKSKSYFDESTNHAAGAWKANGGPFWELISFSDCEGVLGTSVCAKLAKDFAEYQSAADKHKEEWFRDRYCEWRKVFELAADGGAVKFH